MLEEKQQQLQIRMKHFSEVSETFINPLMKEAGINNPVAYQDKLYELYSEQPKEKELKLLDENNLKLLSATKYAKTRKEVEKEIQDRWNAAAAEKAQASSETPAVAPVNASASASSDQDGFLDGWLNKTAS